jgi:hypothetical protein
MMNGYNFTERVRRVLQNAREELNQSVKYFALDVTVLLYEIVHDISAERTRSIPPAAADITENPPMIHPTDRANHPTKDTAFLTRSVERGVETGAGGVPLDADAIGQPRPE